MSELRFPGINNCTISGRLTRDVELRYTQGGSAVAKMGIAFDRNYKKGEEWERETSFMDVTVWTKLAERCAEYLHKGSPIVAEGYVKTGSYDNKEGNKVKTFELVAHKIYFLEKSEQSNNEFEVGKRVVDEQKTDNGLPF